MENKAEKGKTETRFEIATTEEKGKIRRSDKRTLRTEDKKRREISKKKTKEYGKRMDDMRREACERGVEMSKKYG